MFHRECGYYKTSYVADQAILPFPIAKQAIIGFLIIFAVLIPVFASEYYLAQLSLVGIAVVGDSDERRPAESSVREVELEHEHLVTGDAARADGNEARALTLRHLEAGVLLDRLGRAEGRLVDQEVDTAAIDDVLIDHLDDDQTADAVSAVLGDPDRARSWSRVYSSPSCGAGSSVSETR